MTRVGLYRHARPGGFILWLYGAVAQLARAIWLRDLKDARVRVSPALICRRISTVEGLPCKQDVAGSNPAGGSDISN